MLVNKERLTLNGFLHMAQISVLSSFSTVEDNTHTSVLRPFFWDHPGEPMPEENFWTLRCKGRLTEADTPAIRLGATVEDNRRALGLSVLLLKPQVFGRAWSMVWRCMESRPELETVSK